MARELKHFALMRVFVTMLAVAAGPIAANAQDISGALPSKTWSCAGNTWVLNGVELRFLERGLLSMALGGQVLPAGCYWYDPMSGMIGREGAAPGGDIPAGLEIGGPLRPDASNGDSNIFLNGREMTRMEVASFRKLGATFTRGRYWMNQQGIGGREGQPAEFQLYAAAAHERAPVQPAPRRRQGGSNHLYNSNNSYGGIQGDCVYMSSGNFSYMGSGC